MNNSQVSISQASELLKESGKSFLEIFKHGTLVVEFYKPHKKDLQKPHDRDEVYLIASGNGMFYNNGITTSFNSGDFLFVPAHAVHYFENFSDDFSTWVLFYGPVGGEQEEDQ
ncbi:MAG: hypothetical protein NVSMB45_18920 [Ginsengibacter sp.]